MCNFNIYIFTCKEPILLCLLRGFGPAMIVLKENTKHIQIFAFNKLHLNALLMKEVILYNLIGFFCECFCHYAFAHGQHYYFHILFDSCLKMAKYLPFVYSKLGKCPWACCSRMKQEYFSIMVHQI